MDRIFPFLGNRFSYKEDPNCLLAWTITQIHIIVAILMLISKTKMRLERSCDTMDEFNATGFIFHTILANCKKKP